VSEGERVSRIAALVNEIRESLAMLESNLPRQIDGFALSQKSKLPWKVLLYREALIWRIVELGRIALESFLSERIVSGVVLTRSAVEASAALWYLSAKVDAVVDSKTVGDVDEYLMKLAMGTATGWPETDTSADVLTMPRPIKIGAFLKQVEKDIEGFSGSAINTACSANMPIQTGREPYSYIRVLTSRPPSRISGKTCERPRTRRPSV
jgi:hypothetical protein